MSEMSPTVQPITMADTVAGGVPKSIGMVSSVAAEPAAAMVAVDEVTVGIDGATIEEVIGAEEDRV